MSYQNLTQTTNGMAAVKSSLNACVDLFAQIGNARTRDITPAFLKALREDQNIAMRVLQWSRDIRGGAGERDTFRKLLVSLTDGGHTDLVVRLIAKVPEIGRWDDLFVLIGKSLHIDSIIAETFAQALVEKNGLCAKWLPREGKKYSRFFMNSFELTERQYRKLIVGLSKTVEQQMCAQQWDQIEFGKIPSLAAKNYQKAFHRNAPEQYQEYIDGLASGKTKINAGAIFPYDVIRGLNGIQGVADAQWKALPDYMAESTENLLAIVDVSSSMNTRVSDNLTAMEVAVSLGMYVAERSKGAFKDKFLTFDSNPRLIDLSNARSLTERVRITRSAPWGGSTDLEKTFKLILETAVQNRVPASDMPTKIILWSDMQFNSAMKGGEWGKESAYIMIDNMYAKHGYKRPEIIFWIVAANQPNFPVTFGAGRTAMLSGFSPAIMKAVLANSSVPEMTPMSMMLDAVNIERYDW
jgi:hypothetical protein